MTGVYGVRYTIVFTLQVAATPFHQGLLALNWQYGVNAAKDRRDPYVRSIQSATCTNIPHVRLDLSVDTMVQLRVPFLSQAEYGLVAASNANIRPYGLLACNSLMSTPLPTGGVAPGYQLYIHLEDIEFFHAMPQATTTVLLQAGALGREFESESHPFSSATSAMSRVVRFVGKGIPALSPLSVPVSWFLEKSAGALRAFGFSRPQVVEPVQRIIAMDTIGECNVDVPSSTITVGPFASNTLVPTPTMGGIDVDEMALNYVLTKHCQITQFTIAAAVTPGTLLYVCPVAPSYMWFRQSTVAPFCQTQPKGAATLNRNGFLPSGVFFFSQFCKFWRGGMKFRFSFAKTKLHGGRVMVTFTPTPYFNSSANTGGLGTHLINNYSASGSGPDPFAYSAVFNLKDGNIFEFDVPYINPTHWSNFYSSTGTLTMHMVDALQYSGMISNSIECMVEVAAGDDYELADPVTPIYSAIQDPTPLFQAGEISTVPEKISLYTTGESVNSVKQLIQIPKMTIYDVVAGSPFSGVIPPWYVLSQPDTSVPGPLANLSEAFSVGGLIAKAYLYASGGTDFHAYFSNSGSSTKAVLTVAQISENGYGTSGVSSPTNPGWSNNSRVINTTTGNIHVRLPAYQRFVRMLSHLLDGLSASWAGSLPSVWDLNTALPTSLMDWIPGAFYKFTWMSPVAQPLYTFRAASDDARLGCYLGPPPLLLLSAVTAASPWDVDSRTAIIP
jgi:hypothetical protein